MAEKEEMQSSEPVDSALGRPPRTRWAAMWVLLLLSLVGISGPWLVHPFFFGWGLAPVHIWRDLILALIYLPLAEAFYTSPLWFLLLWGGGLALCTLLWQVSRRGRFAKTLALLPLGCLLFSPLAVVLKYGSFDTVEALRAHEGYEVDWLTEPEHALAGLVRRAQFRFTMGGCVVDLCEPELVGWDDRNRLFYTTHHPLADSYCSRTEGHLWVYDPATDNRPQRIQELPDGVEFVPYAGAVPFRINVEELVVRESAVAADFDRDVEVLDERISPNGEMLAIVVFDWSTLDSDIIVFRRAVQ